MGLILALMIIYFVKFPQKVAKFVHAVAVGPYLMFLRTLQRLNPSKAIHQKVEPEPLADGVLVMEPPSDKVTAPVDHANEETLARVKKIVWYAGQTSKWVEAHAYIKKEFAGEDLDYARKSLVAAEMRVNAQKDAAQKAAHKAEVREMVTEARRLIAAKKAEREQAMLSIEIPPEGMIPEDNEEQRADYR